MIAIIIIIIINNNNNYYYYLLLLLLIYCRRSYSRHCGIGARQRQVKRREGRKREESEGMGRDRGTEGETSYPNPCKWRAYRGRRAEWKTRWKRKKRWPNPQPSYPVPFRRTQRHRVYSCCPSPSRPTVMIIIILIIIIIIIIIKYPQWAALKGTITLGSQEKRKYRKTEK